MVHFKEFKNKLENDNGDPDKNQYSAFNLKGKKKKFFLLENEEESRGDKEE